MAIQLPALHQRIVLDPTGVKGGAAAYSKAMGGVSKSSNQAANSTSKMGQALNTVAFRAQTAGRILLKNFALPLGAIGGVALKSFAQFEQSMIKIEALVGVSAGQVERFGEAVKAASAETGRGPQELADAMFFVASAGLRGATAMEVLGASARGAAIGLGETKVVADAATSAVNAYGAENLSGSAAVDVLTAAVREGKVEANRLAPAIGKAIPVASAMGIEFHEVAAAIAAMTRTGTDARTSAIQLRQIMQSLLDPSRQTTKALKEMGIAEGELRRQADDEGLLAVLVRLRDLAKENEDAFADVFPNIRALAGALDITGANLTENEGIFRALANSVGDTDEAFNKTTKGAMFRFNRAMTDLKTNMLGLGEAMLPLLEIFVKMIGLVSGVVKALSASPFAKTLAVMIALTSVVGTLLITFGKFAAILVFVKGATLALASSSTAAAAGVTLLKLALGGIVLAVAAVAIIGLTTAIFGWGKASEETSDALAKLSGEIRDVRQMGERSIRPIHQFTDALTNMTGAIDDPQLIRDFNLAFQDAIQSATALSGLGGQLQAEESILQGFFGALAGVDDDAVISDTFDVFQQLLDRFRVQFKDQNFLTRLFGNPEDMDAALLSFLKGQDPEGVADQQIQIWADRVRGTFNTALDDAMEQLPKDRGNQRTDAMERAIESTAEALETPLNEISELFNKALLSGNPEVAINIYSELWDALVADTERGTDKSKIAIGGFEKAFMDSLHSVDAFTEDSAEGIDDLSTMLQILATDQDKVLRGEFSGRDNVVDFATEYSRVLNDLIAQAENPALRDLDWFNMSPETMHREALEQAIDNVKRLNDTYRTWGDTATESIDTVADALVEMEKGFAAADAAAKQLDDRFDNLMGRGINLEESFLDFNDGMRETVEALDDSEGSINRFTAAGSDARRELLSDIEAAKEYAENMLAMNFTMEEAEAQFKSMAGVITSNALRKGVDKSDLDELFKGINLTGDGMTVMFADPEAEASEALMAAAEAIADGAKPFVFREGLDIGGHLLEGFTKGMRGGDAELRKNTKEVFGGLILKVKEIFGIESPSIVFRDEIGKPLMEGITVGFAQEAMASKGKWKNILRSFINDAISVTQGHINSASSAVNAILSLEEAEKRLAKAKRDHMNLETGGSRSERELLTQEQLQNRVKQAERALRLGQGLHADLKMSLLDATQALADFEADIDSDSPIQKAELELMNAGFAVADSTAQMKMDGEDATTAFANMAEAVGISVDKVNALLAVPTRGQSIFEDMFPENVRTAIDEVANGIGWVETATKNATDAAVDLEMIWATMANIWTGASGAGFVPSSGVPPSQLAGIDPNSPGRYYGSPGLETGPQSLYGSGITLPVTAISPASVSFAGSNNTQMSGDIHVHVDTTADLSEIDQLVDGWMASGIGQSNRNAETGGILNGDRYRSGMGW